MQSDENQSSRLHIITRHKHQNTGGSGATSMSHSEQHFTASFISLGMMMFNNTLEPVPVKASDLRCKTKQDASAC